MDCRENCGACCIAPSINGPVPDMPQGKPAGVPCIQLDETFRCKIFGLPNRPACCGGLKPSEDMCGKNRTEALLILTELERLTQP